MNYVSILLLSHSNELVSGLHKLLKQIQPHVEIIYTGGLKTGELGTDVFQIKKCLESISSEKGIVILFDLGSAYLNAEMAIELLDESRQVMIADAPLVEGAYAAVVEAGCGGSIEEVVYAAEMVSQIKKVPSSN